MRDFLKCSLRPQSPSIIVVFIFLVSYCLDLARAQIGANPSALCSPGCAMKLVGDGLCQQACLTQECNFDAGDCCQTGLSDSEPVAVCLKFMLGDRFCDSQCNNLECAFDGGDCAPTRCRDNLDDCPEESIVTLSNCTLATNFKCPINFIGDSFCDPKCNGRSCSLDGGDCDDVGILALAITAAVVGGLCCLCLVIGTTLFCIGTTRSMPMMPQMFVSPDSGDGPKRFETSSNYDNYYTSVGDPAFNTGAGRAYGYIRKGSSNRNYESEGSAYDGVGVGFGSGGNTSGMDNKVNIQNTKFLDSSSFSVAPSNRYSYVPNTSEAAKLPSRASARVVITDTAGVESNKPVAVQPLLDLDNDKETDAKKTPGLNL